MARPVSGSPGFSVRPDILIIGQGLAGTLLGWELERAGIAFEIADCGHSGAASSAAAGIINPVTGRRLAKSWRFEIFAGVARESYVAIERTLAVPLWREMRMRRLFADEKEREFGSETMRRTAVAAFIESADDSGWSIHGAARVDLAALLEASRKRWLRSGVLQTRTALPDEETRSHALVIDCRGRAGAGPPFERVPWEFAKGEVLELRVDGLEQNVILNRRFWILPLRPGEALAGATYEPGEMDPHATSEARSRIEAAAREILGDRKFVITTQRAGIRVYVPDRHPVAGRHPTNPRLGIVNGLGAKGALWAPELARQWARHLTTGAAFDREIDVTRFWQLPQPNFTSDEH